MPDQSIHADLYAQALRLVQEGRVLEVRTHQAGAVVTGIVGATSSSAESGSTYRVYARRTSDAGNGSSRTALGSPTAPDTSLRGECSCGERPICVHIAAVSIAAAKTANTEPRQGRSAGIDPPPSTAIQQRLFYLLNSVQGQLQLSTWVGHCTEGSRPNSIRPFAPRISDGGGRYPRYVDKQDAQILQAVTSAHAHSPWDLRDEAGSTLIRQMIDTGRAYWSSVTGQPLRSGETRKLDFAWHILPNGNQQFACATPGPLDVFLSIEPPMYVDSAQGCVGFVEHEHPLYLLRRCWSQSAVAPEQVDNVNEEIAHGGQMRDLAAGSGHFPQLARVPIHTRALSRLKPRLVLSGGTRQSPLSIGESARGPGVSLYFVYNGLAVNHRHLGDAHSVRQMADGVLHEIERDRLREERWQAQLQDVLPASSDTRQAWLAFMLKEVPTLIADGWEVEIDTTFPYRIATSDGWYGDLKADPSQRTDWFNLRLGMVVDGQPINLLPALMQYLRTMCVQSSLATEPASETHEPAAAKSDSLPESSGCRVGDYWLTRLPDGRYLTLAIERIQRIAQTLVELFDRHSLNGQDSLALPRGQTARLAQLSHDLPDSALRIDDPSVKTLIEEIRQFNGITPQDAPSTFRAQLRDYQRDGLGWLQFLRRYRLGGVLADDMGLGKTIQTLAHLTLEKKLGHLQKPSLIVAPVSAIGNWQREILRFAPDLSLQIWHGSRRRDCLQNLGTSDVVITAYPLLHIDSEILLAREFYLVILDEAQTIKNSRAQVSQMARALRAEHRLCLTGTPIENHLGELWSLFDFLLPGLLGEERHFQRHYRTPIEKNGDKQRAQALSARVAPFLLRRTKDRVAKELPAKTEIIESVVLDERQRDFYDGIRLAAHEQIREIVALHGLARSQISILDALLKLRQACCDPRLVKMPVTASGSPVPSREAQGSPEAIPSAKLDWLKDSVPELIEEGRRILLFSQFTSMLRLIEAALTQLAVPYCLLTGETRDRPAVVDRFQSGAVPVFLISLKAGGTALNLTRADTVIHYDPWWNPAVEAQATDRAHRIGQDKPVFVYKLIAQGTVEERILQLQADKHALATDLWAAKSSSTGGISAADLEFLLAS